MRNTFTPVFLFFILFLAGRCTYAQTGMGTNTPDNNAMLDISSTQKGVLLPRLNAAQLAILAASLTPAETGMLVADSATGKPISWNGSSWSDLAGNTLTTTPPLSISQLNTIALNPGTAAGDLITWNGSNWINIQPATQHFNVTVDNRQAFLTINYCIALVGVFPSRSSSEPFLSEIEMYGFGFAPKGWAFCNGQLLPINQNQAIFSLLGTTYGGNGINNFALPNLQGRVPLHFGNGAGLSPYVLGQTGGSDLNTISR